MAFAYVPAYLLLIPAWTLTLVGAIRPVGAGARDIHAHEL